MEENIKQPTEECICCAIRAEKPSMWQRLVWWVREWRYRIKSRFVRLLFWIIELMTADSNLTKHAERELRLAGLFDKDSDYDGMLAAAIMDLVRVFSLQDHSGFSAGLTMRYFGIVAGYKTLTPITSNPEEWSNAGMIFGDSDSWQNKRDSRCFSGDGGKTWYNYEDCRYTVRDKNGVCFTTTSVNSIEKDEEIIERPKCDKCMIKETCERKTAQ